MKTQRHILGILVEDQPGVMARVSGLFARRGFNINTITVGSTRDAGISKMIFSINGDDKLLEQVVKQVNKLVSVIKISELKPSDSIIKEIALIKISIPSENAKFDIIKCSEIYKAKISDLTHKSAILQLHGEPEKIDAFIHLVKRYGIKEVSRTGVTAMSRGICVLNNKN
ncbi:acetolactate synthase small subunit [Candidatus Woesearchaeota archaeon]|nr:acetolactate synthase small subunit [Candidatus Woesearchaeota archaeon]